MKKRILNKINFDFNGTYTVSEVECEIYEYGGYKFGIYWDRSKYGTSHNVIHAIEVESGAHISSISSSHKAPKRSLLEDIAMRVDSGNVKLLKFRTMELANERRGLVEKTLALMPKMPINKN